VVVVIPVSAAEIPPGAGSVDIVPQELSKTANGASRRRRRTGFMWIDRERI
jgi:hypothetical protein